MSALEYINIKAYRVTWRLRGMPIKDIFRDDMAEYLPCGSCGAPAGHFCLQWPDTRFTCKGTAGSQNPRTLLAFAKQAEEIQAQEAKKK